MPRIEGLEQAFGEKVPEGVDLEKTGAWLDEKVEAMLEAERNGVRASEQKNFKELQDKYNLTNAELEDLRNGGKPGATTPEPTSATEPGSRAEAIRKQQADAKAEADRQAAIDAAVGKTKKFFVASAAALKDGIPESVVQLAGEDPDKLEELTVMYRAMNPSGEKPGEKKPGTGGITPGSTNSKVGVDDGKATSFDRSLALVNRLPTMSMQGGVPQDLNS